MAFFDLPRTDLERYAPEIEEPADFDAFWGAALILVTVLCIVLGGVVLYRRTRFS